MHVNSNAEIENKLATPKMPSHEEGESRSEQEKHELVVPRHEALPPLTLIQALSLESFLPQTLKGPRIWSPEYLLT